MALIVLFCAKVDLQADGEGQGAETHVDGTWSTRWQKWAGFSSKRLTTTTFFVHIKKSILFGLLLISFS